MPWQLHDAGQAALIVLLLVHVAHSSSCIPRHTTESSTDRLPVVGASGPVLLLRTLFGFDPQWLAADIPHAELYLRDVPRGGFSGTLSGVRFLGEHVEVAAGAAGVSMGPAPQGGG